MFKLVFQYLQMHVMDGKIGAGGCCRRGHWKSRGNEELCSTLGNRARGQSGLELSMRMYSVLKNA